MPVKGGIEPSFLAKLSVVSGEEPAALKQKFATKLEQQTSIWQAMENFIADEMINPRETRRYSRLVRLAYRQPLLAAR